MEAFGDWSNIHEQQGENAPATQKQCQRQGMEKRINKQKATSYKNMISRYNVPQGSFAQGSAAARLSAGISLSASTDVFVSSFVGLGSDGAGDGAPAIAPAL